MGPDGIFSCPVCGQPLVNGEKTLSCENGHSYDIAAQGYVHLLAPNRMHAKIPGDSKQMVNARRAFLETGWYQPFSDRLNQLVLQAVAGIHKPFILDAGCGEGYYTARLAAFLQAKGVPAVIAGVDISKFAVRAAAKRDHRIAFSVGSLFHIPVADEKMDCLYNVFAPIVPTEFFRVLKPGGTLILAVPSKRHLFGLKQVLYEAPYENEEIETEYTGFCFRERVPVRGELTTEDRDLIQNLFAMTPYYWKTPVAGCERLRETGRLETEIGFDFLIYEKQRSCTA